MATPIGHALVGGLLYFTGNRSHTIDVPVLLVYVFFANAPDLDFLLGILIGDPGAFHHGITHSLGFGVLFTAVVAAVLALTWQRFANYGLLKLAVVGFLAYASHLLVDFLTLDERVPYGMPLFWPFSNQYVHAPVYIIPNVLHSASQLSLHNLNVAFRELVVFGVPLLYLMTMRWWMSPRAKIIGIALVTVLVGAALGAFVKVNPYF